MQLSNICLCLKFTLILTNLSTSIFVRMFPINLLKNFSLFVPTTEGGTKIPAESTGT